MIPYIGCERARELLDAFVDQELPVSDQVMVEAHLRWCRTCTARVEDMQLIGVSIRLGSAAVRPEDEQQLAATCGAVLARVRTEQEQSLGVRLREGFADMRLLWPLLGATAAVVVGAGVALGVLRSAARERPESLAAMIESLAEPGSERNPIWADNVAQYELAVRTGRPFENRARDAISLPRVLDAGSVLEQIPNEDAVFALATVVNRQGRIADLELLQAAEATSAGSHAGHVKAVLDAVRQSRFQPAQEHRGVFGRTVAVNMVWVIVHQTVKGSVEAESRSPRALRPSAPARPAVADPAAPPTEPQPPATQGAATA